VLLTEIPPTLEENKILNHIILALRFHYGCESQILAASDMPKNKNKSALGAAVFILLFMV